MFLPLLAGTITVALTIVATVPLTTLTLVPIGEQEFVDDILYLLLELTLTGYPTTKTLVLRNLSACH